MMKSLSTLCVALLTITSAFSQDANPQEVSQFLDQAIYFKCRIIVLDADQKEIKSFDASRAAILGKPVTIQLKSKTINGELAFTSYGVKDKQFVLVAQTQLVVQVAPDKAGQYIASVISIPIVLGDKIQYYPLGKASPAGTNIKAEITIQYYKDATDRPLPPLPQPSPRPEEQPSKGSGDQH